MEGDVGREPDREVTEISDHYEVALTDEGWGVWERRTSTGDPLAMYPPGDDGFESAYEHFVRLSRADRRTALGSRLRPAAFWTAIVAGAIWIVTSGLYSVWIFFAGGRFEPGFVFEWLGAINQAAYPAFLVAFAVHVMLWLEARDR